MSTKYNNNITISTKNRLIADVHYFDQCYQIRFILDGKTLGSYSVADKYYSEEDAIGDLLAVFIRQYPEYKNRKPIILTHWDEN